MGAKFVPNPAGLAAAATMAGMFMASIAENIAEAAQSIAPVGDSAPHYKDMIRAEGPVTVEGKLGWRVNAWKYTSGFLEFGTSDTPAFAVLRRASESTGL